MHIRSSSTSLFQQEKKPDVKLIEEVTANGRMHFSDQVGPCSPPVMANKIGSAPQIKLLTFTGYSEEEPCREYGESG